MAPILPPEIISRIIECAAEIDYLDEHYHTHNIYPLLNLCLVSRLFYRLSAALIYRDVIVPAGWELENIIKQLVPLLSLEQRRKLRESLESAPPDGDETELLKGGELEDAGKLLVDQERIVDPARVKRLIIWDAGVDGETDLYREYLWRAIDVAMTDMAGLQYFHNEIGWDYQPIHEKLSTLESMHHLGTGRANSLSFLELPLTRPLRSLTICYSSLRVDTAAAWSRVLQESSSSLRVLYLSFQSNAIPIASIDKRYSALLTDQRTSLPIVLPQLEELYIDSVTEGTIPILVKSIDFGQLLVLQLFGFPYGVPNGVLGAGTQLSRLQRLSLYIPGSVVPLLRRCTGRLEELYILTNSSDRSSVAEILPEISKHGRTLKVLSLDHKIPMDTDQLFNLTHECSQLERLLVNVKITDWNKMALCLMEVPRLRYLELIKYTLDSNTNTHAISPNGGQWWDPEDPPEIPELLNPLDYTVGDLLYNSTKFCKDRAIPWRTGCSLRYIRISAPGVKKHSVTQYVSRAYELRQDSFEVEPDELHLDTDLAPSGTEYTFENSGVRVAIRAVEPSARYLREMGYRALPPPWALELWCRREHFVVDLSPELFHLW